MAREKSHLDSSAVQFEVSSGTPPSGGRGGAVLLRLRLRKRSVPIPRLGANPAASPSDSSASGGCVAGDRFRPRLRAVVSKGQGRGGVASSAQDADRVRLVGAGCVTSLSPEC